MKRIIIFVTSVSLILFFNTTCALEIANVIGPDGGYVFYDKGSYNFGWRYLQCSPYDFSTIRLKDIKDLREDSGKETIVKLALRSCSENNANWHKFGWEIPKQVDLEKLLECFSYGFTRFSPDYYYLAVNELYDDGRYWVCTATSEGIKNTGDFCSECGAPANSWVPEKDQPPNPANLKDSKGWEIVILHKNFENTMNGVVEEIEYKNIPDEDLPEIIRVRAIRRF